MLFIYSKLEPAINKLYRNVCISGKPRVWGINKMCLYWKYGQCERDCVMCVFLLILVNVSSYNILIRATKQVQLLTKFSLKVRD